MQSRDTIILPAVSGAEQVLKKPSTRFVVINGLRGVVPVSPDEIRAIETHLKLEMEALLQGRNEKTNRKSAMMHSPTKGKGGK